MNLFEHLEKLRHFHRLRPYKSFKEASRKIGISQAGISKSVAALEEVLCTKLIIRSTRGISLTQSGHILMDFAVDLFDRVLLVEGQIRKREISQVVNRKMMIGTYDSIAVYFLPELISYLSQVYPRFEFDITIDHSAKLQDFLLNGKLDIAIGVNLSSTHKEVVIESLFTDFYGFFVRPSALSSISLHTPILFHPHAQDASGKSCQQYLQRVLRHRRTIKNENFETIKSLTLSGIGIGVLPQNVALPEVKQGKLIQCEIYGFPKLFGSHQIRLGYMKQKHRDFDQVIEDVLRVARSWTSN